MIQQEVLKNAVERSLEFWTYLHEHPKIKKKRNTPPKIYALVKDNLDECPLCEVLKDEVGCSLCPLISCLNIIGNKGGDFQYWCSAINDKERRKYSGQIVDKLTKWLEENQ